MRRSDAIHFQKQRIMQVSPLQYPAVSSELVIILCVSLLFFALGALVGCLVGAGSRCRASSFLLMAIAGAVGGIVGGLLAFLLTYLLYPAPREHPPGHLRFEQQTLPAGVVPPVDNALDERPTNIASEWHARLVIMAVFGGVLAGSSMASIIVARKGKNQKSSA
jgi:uncharacterized membrane protein YedE/YeeE